MIKEPLWERENFSLNDQHMLKELVKRHRKYQNHKANRNSNLILFSSITGISTVFFLAIMLLNNRYTDLWAILELTFGNIFFTLLVIIIGFFYLRFALQVKKTKKEKDKYHTLRKEVVDKTEEHWIKKYGESKVLELVKELNDEHDIEVSFKG